MGTPVAVAAKKNETQVEVMYDFGDSLDEAVTLFGKETVHDNFVANAKIGLQAFIRRHIEGGYSADTIQQRAAMWKPGITSRTPVDPLAAVLAAFGTMSQEQKAAFLGTLQAKFEG